MGKTFLDNQGSDPHNKITINVIRRIMRTRRRWIMWAAGDIKDVLCSLMRRMNCTRVIAPANVGDGIDWDVQVMKGRPGNRYLEPSGVARSVLLLHESGIRLYGHCRVSRHYPGQHVPLGRSQILDFRLETCVEMSAPLHRPAPGGRGRRLLIATLRPIAPWIGHTGLRLMACVPSLSWIGVFLFS